MSLSVRSPKDWLLVLAVLSAGIVAGILLRPALANPFGKKTTLVNPLPASAGPKERPRVTALGRLRPGRGVVRVAGPSHAAVVIGKLMVEEGDRVQRGQPIAFLDNRAALEAGAERLRARVDAQLAELAGIEAAVRLGKAEYSRLTKLHQEGATSDSQLDVARLAAESAMADLERARAEIALARADLRQAEEQLQLSVVRSPVSGQVLKIHAREGEKAGPDGIAEIADTEQMYAVAEVYETDVAKIRVGQRATVSVPTVDRSLSGIVERVGLKVGKMDVLGTDPVARTDARVVEVEVRLDDSARVRNVTNMQVLVSIDAADANAPLESNTL